MNIALLGHGVVGSGVVEVLTKNSASIEKKAGEAIEIKYILDKREFKGCGYEEKFTKNFDDILNDKSVSVVVEVMGGVTPAYDFVRACLEAGKSAVTSNKELVAEKGALLLEVAAKNNVNFLFEASVGGGIPIIRPLHQCLAANEICEVAGILNGTTNFILTKMIKEGMSFEIALDTAQKLGYAEADPTADVGGHDACRKTCILASLAFGSHVYPQNVYTQGITEITSADVAYAQNAGCVIKLIGRAKRGENGKVIAMVSPAMLNNSSQLASVDDVFNGILVRGDAIGDVVFYGKGAGKLPTASAVVGDIIDCVKASGTIKSLHWLDSKENNVEDYLAQPVCMYVRCDGQNISRTDIQKLFASENLQFLSRTAQPQTELAFIAPVMREGQLEEVLLKLAQSNIEILAKIRMLEY